MIDIENKKSGSPCKIANKLGTARDRESQHVTRAWATLSSESLPHKRACIVCTSITHQDTYVYDVRETKCESECGIQESWNLGNVW